MINFITEDFLLQSKTANTLYHEYAAHQPIIDYHNHLPPAEIANDRQFENITQVWLAGDHYKWRAMRAHGVDEHYITGDASDEEKFRKWAETVPYTLRNPLYEWTHLELKNYFGVDKLLNGDTADEIYQHCNEKLQTEEFSTRNLLRKVDARIVCTTDDPVDSLEYHQQMDEDDDLDIKVLPAFRPDQAYAFDDPESYNNYIDELAEVAGIPITKFDDLLEALIKRVHYFHKNGCRLSDHGVTKIFFEPASHKELETAFQTIRNGSEISEQQQHALTHAIMLELCREYDKHNWVQQFHLGALRNNNQRMFRELGPDTGWDSIGDYLHGETLSAFLDQLDSTDQLAKTILYNVNPRDNELFTTMAGNFNDGTVKGKVQHGAAWWFLDQKHGIERHLNSISDMGLLSSFVGMLTDSRSFLSFPRHEYFRRVLCNLIGEDIEAGILPDEIEWTGKIVEDICYHNANEYFNF